MEEIGIILGVIGRLLQAFSKLVLFLFWGISRIAETILHELNALLKRILDPKER